MTACDCIITKAGPGTIAEALICGLPILLNGASITTLLCFSYLEVSKLGLFSPASSYHIPVVLGYIPCQEEGNVSFVLENGVGAYSEKPDEIAEIVSAWFDKKNSDIEIMSSKAKSLGRPEATFNIVRDLAGDVNLRRTYPIRFFTSPEQIIKNHSSRSFTFILPDFHTR